MTVLALALFLTTFASSPSRFVLVLPPEASTAPQEMAWVGEVVSDLLPGSLAAAGLPAVERADRLRAQEALEIPGLVPLTRATSIRIGEALGAAQLVIGSYRVEGKALTLSLRLLDSERGTLSSPFVASGPLETLPELVHSLAWDLALAFSSPPPLTRQEFLARGVGVPTEALRLYGRGLLGRDPALKMKLLFRAAALAPQNPLLSGALGRVQLEAGEPSAAVDTLARVSPDAPQARSARFVQGLALLGVGRYQEAADLYARLAISDPSPAVLANYALALLRGGTKDLKASQILRKVLDLDPTSADAAFNLGWALFVEGDSAGAESHLRGVIRQEPLDGHARLILAWTLSRQGKTAEAQEEWKGVVAMAPSYEGFTTPDLGRRFERLATSEHPLVMKRAARTGAEVVAGLMGRAERLTASGDLDAALQELARAAYLDPYASRVHHLLARALRARGDNEKALTEFRMCLWSGDDAAIRAEMALLLKDMGRVAEARGEAERVLRLEPDNPIARRILEATSSGQ